MTANCPSCTGLRKERNLNNHHKYERVAVRIDKALAAKDMVPDPDEPWDTSVTPYSYDRMRHGSGDTGGMPDIFSYFFRCAGCNRRFNLMCEVYHGSGGYWRVVEE